MGGVVRSVLPAELPAALTLQEQCKQATFADKLALSWVVCPMRNRPGRQRGLFPLLDIHTLGVQPRAPLLLVNLK